MRLRYLAPAGTPVKGTDLLLWIINVLNPGFTRALFQETIMYHFAVPHCYLVSTGRAALTVVLQVMHEMDHANRNEVIIPSYDCFSVPASIVKAGLKIRISDVAADSFDYDFEKLERMNLSNVLCILSANLFGIPNDMKRLQAFANKKSIYVIDDAAQSLSAKVNGQYSGTWGHAGLFSLDKGKNITSIQGGILITRSADIAARIAVKLKNAQSMDLIENIGVALKIIIYSIFLHPFLYWIPNSLPCLKLGHTKYDSDFPLKRYSRVLAAFAAVLFRRVMQITQARITVAEIYQTKLAHIDSITLPQVKSGIDPVYLRYPVLLKSAAFQRELIESLNKAGIGASGFYPTSVQDVKEIFDNINTEESDAVQGRSIAERIVTLPTHAYVTEADILKIQRIMETVLGYEKVK